MPEQPQHALQSEGWRPIREAPRRIQVGATCGIAKDDDLLVHFNNGYATHFMPLPAPPEGEGI